MTRSACRAPIVACALLLCAAEGLRRPRRPHGIMARTGGLPKGRNPVGVYRRAWEHKYVADEQFRNLTQSLPRNLLVLGVPTLPRDEAYRAVMRDTWMRHPLVCGIEMVPKPTCVIHAGFVFGNATSEPILRNGDLHFQMPGPEKAAFGRVGQCVSSGDGEGTLTHKMFLFYQYTSKTFTWASHIVRMDTDFYPHFHLMLPFIQEYHALGREMEYLGKPIVSHSCGARMDDIQAARNQTGEYCLTGSLTVLSRPLAFAISNNFSEYYYPACRQFPHSIDDRQIGHVVTRFVRATREVVTVVRPGMMPGYDHKDYRAGTRPV